MRIGNWCVVCWLKSISKDIYETLLAGFDLIRLKIAFYLCCELQKSERDVDLKYFW